MIPAFVRAAGFHQLLHPYFYVKPFLPYHISRGVEVGLQDRSQVSTSTSKSRLGQYSELKHTGSGGASGDSGPVEVILLSRDLERVQAQSQLALELLPDFISNRAALSNRIGFRSINSVTLFSFLAI